MPIRRGRDELMHLSTRPLSQLVKLNNAARHEAVFFTGLGYRQTRLASVISTNQLRHVTARPVKFLVRSTG
jgi:hypothetical protein